MKFVGVFWIFSPKMTLMGGNVFLSHVVILVFMIIVLMSRCHCRWSMTVMIVVVMLMLTLLLPFCCLGCSDVLSHDDDVTVMC